MWINLKTEERKNSKAYKTLEEIQKLFHLESTYKKEKLIEDERVERRKKEDSIIKERIYRLVFESNPAKGSALKRSNQIYKRLLRWFNLLLSIMDMLKYQTILQNKQLSHL